jgi:4-hydroxybenzoate polyprenyltransferase
LNSVLKIFRINDWWNYIFPPIIGIAFFIQFITLYDFEYFATILALFFTSFVGTASYGFFLNDLTDSQQDKISGKSNSTTNLNVSLKTLIIILTLCIGVVPWFFLPYSPLAIAFYALQLLLLTAYCIPPIRLKNNIYSCIISDALYSSVIPLLISIIIFGSKLSLSIFVISAIGILIIIFFLRGIRNIILHQIIDIEKDLKTGFTTIAIYFGKAQSVKIISKIILPIEILLSLAFVITISFINIRFLLLIPIYTLYIVAKTYEIKKTNIRKEKANPLQLHNDFYEDILPLFFIILLSIHNWYYLIIMAVYLIAFRNKILSLVFLFMYRIIYRKAILWIYYHPVLWLYYKGLRNKYVKKYIG